ncbi:hypothetical protein AVEN_169558-1 [Araneus ventricosus]|uniref:Transposase Tc1-like domain-containing protein n=1 Tax=Araneus ventricosus TaxID=182803 RepID=A0A4Y2MZG4_ARAVE|nr:hypothetical protein AVEN_169558-1 [Araneus ventricosus]
MAIVISKQSSKAKRRRHLCKKIARILVLFGCLSGFLFQTMEFMLLYWTYPTVVDIQKSSPSYLDVPAITVCNPIGIITHILKKNTQITGNHQMARIVRHNDESVREGYIRNGGKEVKLFTSALKAFQCNNRIVMAQRKHLDDFLRGRIIGRLECGRTQLEVSEELGIAQSVISRLWQRFQDDGNVSRCYSTGRPRFTTPNEDRYLAITAKRNRRSTASDLSCQLSSATGTTVSTQTVYRRLGHIGLYARRPVRCVPLTATHCRLRLAWSREHALWTPQQWSCVMVSDESRFSLQSDSRRTFIWRAPGTRYHQENTIERHRYGGAGWLVRGGIILGSRTETCMFRM